jgi:hypothetical protein
MSPTQKSILMNLAITQLKMAQATALQAVGVDTDAGQFLIEQFEELEQDLIADLVEFDDEIAQLQRINSIV